MSYINRANPLDGVDAELEAFDKKVEQMPRNWWLMKSQNAIRLPAKRKVPRYDR